MQSKEAEVENVYAIIRMRRPMTDGKCREKRKKKEIDMQRTDFRSLLQSENTEK